MVSVVCSVCVVVESNILICGHVVSVVVLCMWVVGSNIVIGLYILDMWSVLCVPYVCGGI